MSVHSGGPKSKSPVQKGFQAWANNNKKSLKDHDLESLSVVSSGVPNSQVTTQPTPTMIESEVYHYLWNHLNDEQFRHFRHKVFQ